MRGGFDERRGWLEDLSDGDDRVREGVVGGVVGEGVVGEGVIGEGVVRVGVVGFSCITFKFSISLVKLSMHFRRRGSIFFSGGFQLDLFTFNRCLGMPMLLECLKKYLIFSFLHNSLTDSNIGGLVIFGVGTNERPRSSNWRSVLHKLID